MKTPSRHKAWATWLSGIGLVLLGALLASQLIALLLWQYMVAVETRVWPRLPMQLLFADHSQLGGTKVAPFLQFIPELQWSWMRNPADSSALHTIAAWLLDQVHIGLVPALLGVLIALAGGIVSMRQINALAAAKQYNEDRLRRAREYREQHQDPTLERVMIDEPANSGLAGDQADLIEAAEKAWRQERVKGWR
jgi:hypothetical protein